MSKNRNNINQSKKTDMVGKIKSLQEEIAKLKKKLEDDEWASRKTNEGIKVLYKELEKKKDELIKDITERKKAEEALREAKNFSDSIVSSAMDGIIVIDLNGDFVQFNNAFLKMMKYSNEELKDMNIRQLTPEKWLVKDAAQFKELLLGNAKSTYYEKELIGKDGPIFPVALTVSLLNDEEDKPIAMVGIIRDETERKRAEEALRESEEKMRTILDSMPDVVLQLDTNLEIIWANKATHKLNPHAIGQLCYKALSGRNDECPGCPIVKALKTGEIQRGIVHLRSVTGVGESYWDDVGVPIKDTRGKITSIVKLAKNVTERKKAEKELKKLYTELKESQAQLIQSEKMSAVGTLVAGVAHELNNPITAILHFTQYCINHTSEEDRLYTILQDIEKETRYCIDTTQNLLTFSHMQRGEAIYQKESLNTIFSRVLKLLSYRIEKNNISITKHMGIGIPDILMNVNNMQQVFLNLIDNALDALKESKQKKIDIDILRKDKYVRVTIADSGCGIAPENIDNIFDPFFTTKSVGKGTGLGLSLCHSIIKAHNGEITCESVPGQGTKFKILLLVNGKK